MIFPASNDTDIMINNALSRKIFKIVIVNLLFKTLLYTCYDHAELRIPLLFKPYMPIHYIQVTDFVLNVGCLELLKSLFTNGLVV